MIVTKLRIMRVGIIVNSDELQTSLLIQTYNRDMLVACNTESHIRKSSSNPIAHLFPKSINFYLHISTSATGGSM